MFLFFLDWIVISWNSRNNLDFGYNFLFRPGFYYSPSLSLSHMQAFINFKTFHTEPSLRAETKFTVQLSIFILYTWKIRGSFMKTNEVYPRIECATSQERLDKPANCVGVSCNYLLRCSTIYKKSQMFLININKVNLTRNFRKPATTLL